MMGFMRFIGLRNFQTIKKIIGEDGAIFGVMQYRMAVTGLMILAGEIAFQPEEYSLYVLVLIMFLLAIPVLISPVSSLIGNLQRHYPLEKQI